MFSAFTKPRASRLAALAVALLLSMCAGCATHSSPATKEFSADQWVADLDALRAALALRHPRYSDAPLPTDLAAAFDSVRAEIRSPMNRTEGFRRLGRLNPAFEDAHTLVMPLPEEVGALQDEPGRLFPFGIEVRAGRLYIDGSRRRESDGAEVADGTEISAINGLPSRTLLDRLLAYGHGETPVLREHMLRVMFKDWLFAVMGWQDRFSVTLRDRDGRSRTVEAMRGDRWAAVDREQAPETPRVRFLADGTAYLRLATFDVDEAPEAFDRAVDKAFSAILARGTDRLILDVRGNTGGQSDAGAAVLRYLIDRPIVQVASARERLHEGNNGLLGLKGKPGEVLTIALDDQATIQPLVPEHRFRGRVAVLMDALTYSAGILFISTVRDHRLGILVGQATGGFANQTGNMEPFVLPHSGLLVYIPARVFVRPSGDPRLVPIEPDVVVEAPALFDDDDAVIAAAVARLQRADDIGRMSCEGGRSEGACGPGGN